MAESHSEYMKPKPERSSLLVINLGPSYRDPERILWSNHLSESGHVLAQGAGVIRLKTGRSG